MQTFWPVIKIRWLLLIVGTSFLLVTTLACLQSFKFWRELKSNPSGWIGKVHRADEKLGYSPIPISSGAMVLSDGSAIPVFYDSYGFRSDSQAVLQPKSIEHKRSGYILSLGCSFTFGFGVQAKSAFCHRVADKLGMVPLNAGRCSYGLAEMLILARRLIPELRPQIVLVQYSPWLAQRSQQRYAPTFYGLLPHAYFTEGGKSGLVVHKPDFSTAIFEKDVSSFRKSEGNIPDLLIFALNFGGPIFFHDFYNASLVFIKNILGLIPEPSTDSKTAEVATYREIASICGQFDSRMFVIVLGSSNKFIDPPDSFARLNLHIVNAQSELVKRLIVDSDVEYARNYYHWGSVPRRVIDTHPNELAHEVVANAVVKSIKQQIVIKKK